MKNMKLQGKGLWDTIEIVSGYVIMMLFMFMLFSASMFIWVIGTAGIIAYIVLLYCIEVKLENIALKNLGGKFVLKGIYTGTEGKREEILLIIESMDDFTELSPEAQKDVEKYVLEQNKMFEEESKRRNVEMIDIYDEIQLLTDDISELSIMKENPEVLQVIQKKIKELEYKNNDNEKDKKKEIEEIELNESEKK